METEHEFMLTLDGVSDLDDEAVDALYEAGCDDSTIMTRAGRVMMGFTRTAPTMKDAIVTPSRMSREPTSVASRPGRRNRGRLDPRT